MEPSRGTGSFWPPKICPRGHRSGSRPLQLNCEKRSHIDRYIYIYSIYKQPLILGGYHIDTEKNDSEVFERTPRIKVCRFFDGFSQQTFPSGGFSCSIHSGTALTYKVACGMQWFTVANWCLSPNITKQQHASTINSQHRAYNIHSDEHIKWKWMACPVFVCLESEGIINQLSIIMLNSISLDSPPKVMVCLDLVEVPKILGHLNTELTSNPKHRVSKSHWHPRPSTAISRISRMHGISYAPSDRNSLRKARRPAKRAQLVSPSFFVAVRAVIKYSSLSGIASGN